MHRALHPETLLIAEFTNTNLRSSPMLFICRPLTPHRVPDNCAYTPMMHPSCLTEPTPVTPDSRPTYHKLNSGLFVFTPSHDTMHQLIHFLATDPRVITYGFPDQDALADFFRGRYKPLPWCYNALKTLRRIHKPMWRDEEIRCIHYMYVRRDARPRLWRMCPC